MRPHFFFTAIGCGALSCGTADPHRANTCGWAVRRPSFVVQRGHVGLPRSNEPGLSVRRRRRGSAACVAAQPPKASSVPAFIAEVNKATVNGIKGALRNVYGDRYFAYFHALETVARVPYFAYTSVLHLYETLGWSRRSDLMKIHFAESWNELHHLLIMESLGGNENFLDRFVAQHMAVGYFFVASLMYMTYPAMAYNLNEQVERHAYGTYDKFLKDKGDELKQMPAPDVAKEYYETGDLYMFDEFHTNTPHERRRPKNIQTLYDVFREIRDDEREHFLTMEAMQHENAKVVSSNKMASDMLKAVKGQTGEQVEREGLKGDFQLQFMQPERELQLMQPERELEFMQPERVMQPEREQVQ